jgi:hypothetical protein
MNSQSQPGLKNTFVAGNLQKLISKRETNQGPSISPTVDESARVWTYMYITLVCENREPICIIIIEICCHVSCCQAGVGYVKRMNISRICSLHPRSRRHSVVDVLHCIHNTPHGDLLTWLVHNISAASLDGNHNASRAPCVIAIAVNSCADRKPQWICK